MRLPRLKPPEPIARVLGRSPLVRDTAWKLTTMVQWMKAIMRTNTGKRQVCQVRNGPFWYDNAVVIEPQGMTSGVEAGCVGVMVKLGGQAEEVALINPSLAGDRPSYVDKRALCLYTPYQSRLFMDEAGDVELGAGLGDYKGTKDFLDEGGKVRLRADGVVEVYSETEIRLRAQPEGGDGPSAVIVLRPSGVLEVTTDAEVSVSAVGSVAVSSEQDVEVEALGDVRVGAGGDVGVEANAEVRVDAAGAITLVSESEVVLQNGEGARVRLSGKNVIVEPAAGGLVQLGGLGGEFLGQANAIAQRLARVENAINFHAHPAHGSPPVANPAIQVPLSPTAEQDVRVERTKSK